MSPETKARSRISSERVRELSSPPTRPKNPSFSFSLKSLLGYGKALNTKKILRARSLSTVFSAEPNELGKRYLQLLPGLLIGGLLYLALLYIFTNIYPNQVANWPLYQSYPLVLILFFFANFFLLSFIFLNRRRGVVFSSILTVLLFLRFQQVYLSLPLLVTAAIGLAGFELVWGVRNRR